MTWRHPSRQQKNNTEVFYEDDYPVFDASKVQDTEISVTKYRSYEAAMLLHEENPDAKIAVMNFANAFHAGGGVVIFKTDEDLPKLMPKDEWVNVDVITIAAPDLRAKSNPYAVLVGDGTYMNKAELFGYHVKRAIHMLTVAAAKGADILVLGAFGCGAFENDPEVVARAYKVALQEFPKVFKKVEFAVYCSPKDSTNYDAFRAVL